MVFCLLPLDEDAAPLGPGLAKLEPFWEGYEDADLVAVPPTMSDTPLPWNWKIHAENFTDAYHPEFVHVGTHDFAPSIHRDGGVEITPMAAEDNAIVRTVLLLHPDGGMMEDGWGLAAAALDLRGRGFRRTSGCGARRRQENMGPGYSCKSRRAVG